KRQIGNHRLAFFDLLLSQPENVDDAKMDPPHLGRVVVQERNNPVLELSVDLNFLVYFALNSRAISLLVPGEERFVAFIHVTANGEMLVKNSCVQFPVVVQFVGNPGRREDIKSKILALPARNTWVTVDPTQTEPA